MRCSPPAAPKSSIDVSDPVPEEVLHQLDALELDPDRPLLICDADEVLFAFVRGLEHYLNDQGLELRLETFALTGNIRDAGSGEPLAAGDVRELLQRFFAERTESLEPIEGARDALATLAERMQIMVLSNIPLAQRQARQRALDRHGMAYPIVANSGRKGGAVARLASRVSAPVVFVDDIPHNLDSVADAAEDVIRLHFVGDERLARLLDIAASAHGRHDTWPDARTFIEARLAQHGF